MIILLAIAAMIIIFIIVGNSASKNSDKQIKLYNQKNNIPEDSVYINCIELNEVELKTPLNKTIQKGQYFSIWKEDQYIKLCKTFYSNDKKIEAVEKTIIPIDNIKFFAREGEYRIDNIIEGGGVSLGGAIVGGVIAGGVGAVLGGRQKITTTTKEIDKRLTYLYYNENNQEKRIAFDSKNYDILLKLIPNKDYSYLEKHNNISK